MCCSFQFPSVLEGAWIIASVKLQHSNSDGKPVSIDMIEQRHYPPSYLYLDPPTPAAIEDRKDEIAKRPAATLTIH
jgi:hypothetical protein